MLDQTLNQDQTLIGTINTQILQKLCKILELIAAAEINWT